jgi:curved DNA-binding protein CbpA
MEVLGLRGGMELERDDINRRFRRLLRDAHPDSGGASAGAAARISELTEARSILLRCAGDSPEESPRGDAVAAEG